VHEAQLHDENAFITLTYDDEHLPEGLDHRHFQLFMKMLRKQAKREGKTVRFYMCGEYGDDFGRPHFHACLFGYNFSDRQHFGGTPDAPLYTSASLDKLWKKGFTTIGEVTFESAAYIARYQMKKITGEQARTHYATDVDTETGELKMRQPEYNQMSRKPGIGANWLRLYWKDVKDGKVVINGKEGTLPRYYKKYFRNTDAKDEMDYEADKLARRTYKDRTEDRLRVKERVSHENIKRLQRTLK